MASPRSSRATTPCARIEYARANWPYVEVMFWYKERANPSVQTVHLEGYALLNPDLSERPVYQALKTYLTSP